MPKATQLVGSRAGYSTLDPCSFQHHGPHQYYKRVILVVLRTDKLVKVSKVSEEATAKVRVKGWGKRLGQRSREEGSERHPFCPEFG